jgi:hypothetical protein
MLYQNKPWIQYEAGATIDEFGLVPNNMNWNMLPIEYLVKNSKTDFADYGPWWFFIFPARKDIKLAFPFFVRGDDVTFSIRNKFKPVLMNGVCSWQESFDAKISPPVEYLAFRSFVMISLVYSQSSEIKICLSILKRLMAELFGLRYQVAFALCEAIKDVMSGPEFWKANVQMANRLGEIRALSGNIDIGEISYKNTTADKYIISKFSIVIMFMTLGGHLIPDFFLKKSIVVEGNSPRPLAACFYNSVCHISDENLQASIFSRNRLKFYKLVLFSMRLTFQFYKSAKRLRKIYIKSLSSFEDRSFWEKQ